MTPYQAELLALLARNRSEDSHLAGGAALNLEPNTRRFSNDLDFFHDSVERVATAFAADERTLSEAGHRVELEMNQPGYIRALVSRGGDKTKIEWAHDSAWRFMPPLASPEFGYVLHPIDLAVNKVLTLAGRNEPRDFIDVLELHERVMPLGALCWAAAGKDPGFTPLSLLEMLRRRGRYQPEDFARLHVAKPVHLQEMKSAWLFMLDEAERFIRARPPAELGCLYYSPSRRAFVEPGPDGPNDVMPHFGRPGGVLPRALENEV